jgi:hypothetical protein
MPGYFIHNLFTLTSSIHTELLEILRSLADHGVISWDEYYSSLSAEENRRNMEVDFICELEIISVSI